MRNTIISLIIFGAALPASANTVAVTLDMTNLPTLASGDYSFAFEMVDGDGVKNNTVTISNFTITNPLVGSLALSGGASGTLATSLSLPDNDAALDGFSLASQQFQHTAGSGAISFDLTDNANFAGGIPDEFNFLILDNNSNPIVSNVNSNVGGLIQIDFGSTVTTQVFAADAAFGSIKPILTPVNAVPEPSSFAFAAFGLALLALVRVRRSSQHS